MTLISAALGAVTLLSGCGMQNMQVEQDQQRCKQYGYAMGTEPFAKCMHETTVERDRTQLLGSLINKIK